MTEVGESERSSCKYLSVTCHAQEPVITQHDKSASLLHKINNKIFQIIITLNGQNQVKGHGFQVLTLQVLFKFQG